MKNVNVNFGHYIMHRTNELIIQINISNPQDWGYKPTELNVVDCVKDAKFNGL